MKTPASEHQMSGINAAQSSRGTTNVLDPEKKSHDEPSTRTSVNLRVEDNEEERHYIIGWRLHLLTFSDIFGRKAMLLIALVLFTAFSIVCGLINNMLELIIFRALQGVGGSGIYSMVTVIAPEMVPLHKIGKYMAIITSVFALASVLGPIFGGVINSHGSWRWVFLLKRVFSTHQPGVTWIAFVGWEGIVGRVTKDVQEAMFPLRLVKDRIFVGLLLNAFFTGFPFMAVIINLPQKFQAVNGSSPTKAGLSLLALLLCSPLASALAGFFVTKLRIAPFYLVIGGAALQLIGVGLTSSLPSSQNGIPHAQYGYEVIMGFGFGFGLATLLTMVPLVVKKEDMPVAMGAITQVRVLGGTIGLAICTAVLNEHVRSQLTSVLPPLQITNILQSVSSISRLDATAEKAVRQVFAEGYSQQMRIMTYFSAVVFLVSLLVWERQPRRVEPTPAEKP
ncbi:MAG: hypothetical protein LQ342_006849 [Letrouitia transgressa]|nr:MAG: hypothetical protein LQ342_006849 [Letrouitia transgressa]